MDFTIGDSVEVTGEIYGTVTDVVGNILYQVCFDKNVVVAVPKKLINLKGKNKVNCIETKEYKPGRFK